MQVPLLILRKQRNKNNHICVFDRSRGHFHDVTIIFAILVRKWKNIIRNKKSKTNVKVKPGKDLYFTWSDFLKRKYQWFSPSPSIKERRLFSFSILDLVNYYYASRLTHCEALRVMTSWTYWNEIFIFKYNGMLKFVLHVLLNISLILFFLTNSRE